MPEVLTLPDDLVEYRQVAPDDASLDGSEPTPGLPLESSVQPGGDGDGSFLDFDELIAVEGKIKEITSSGLLLIENFEGFSATQYNDGGGTMTIGYGTTAAVISPLPEYCTRAQGQTWLIDALNRSYIPAILATGCPLNQNQFNALCSFVYNLGPGSMGAGWRIGAALRAHDIAAVEAVWASYDTVGGQVWAGLRTRREAELARFKTPVPVKKPSPYAIFLDTPVEIDGKKYVERSIVEEFDKLYPDRKNKTDHTELIKLQAEIVTLRKRVWAVSHEAKPASWTVADRGERWQELEKRSKMGL
jgi:lysozyme